MNASPALAMHPSSLVVGNDGEETSLAALLDLCTLDEPEEHEPGSWPARRTLRESGASLVGWAQHWRDRASGWGAGPEGAWRAW